MGLPYIDGEIVGGIYDIDEEIEIWNFDVYFHVVYYLNACLFKSLCD